MIDPKIHLNEQHGIYKIVDVLPKKDKYGHYIYKCICSECGKIKYSHYGAIAGEKSMIKTCNHLRANGQYKKCSEWKNKRIGSIYKGMMSRCYSKTDKDYKFYGEKGVIICDEWLNNPLLFEEWSLLNGYNDDLTIDRIDSEKNYSPDNCQWISLSDNTRKAGIPTWITINNETLTGRQWSKKLNLGVNSVNKWIRNYGLLKTTDLIKEMLKEPPINKKRKSHQTWFDVYNIT